MRASWIAGLLALAACGSVTPFDKGSPDGGGDGDGDGDGDAGIDAPVDALVPRHTVFVSSTTFPADLGGRDVYSTQCQDLAASAGLEGEFVALLHLRSNPLDVDELPIQGPVVNAAGELVAIDAEEFFSGTLRAGNGVSEAGGEPADTVAWIGIPDDAITCGDWGSTAGGGGQVNVTTTSWLTASSEGPCTLTRSIQCISL